jgi:hypothetical protein
MPHWLVTILDMGWSQGHTMVEGLITKFLRKDYCNYVSCVVSGLCSLGPNWFRKMLGLGRGSKQASKQRSGKRNEPRGTWMN